MNELKGFMKKKLPDYMIPSVFVHLDSLPLTVNGKVDHKALPAPDNSTPETGQTLVAPRNELEIQLTEIWEKSLGIHPIGVTDNFFDLGGHSLLAVRLVAEIKKATGKYLTVMSLFHAPTIAQMAKIILDKSLPGPSSSLISIQPRGSKVPLFWLYDTSLVNKLEQDQPLYVLKRLNQDLFLPSYSTIEKIASCFIQDILTLRPEGPYILGGHCFWAIVAFEMAQQLVRKGHEVPLLFLLDPSSVGLPITISCVTNQREDYSFSSSLIHHIRSFAHLQNTEKMAFILQKLTSVFKWPIAIFYAMVKKIIKKIKIIICKTYLFVGRPVPETLSEFYFNESYARELLKIYKSQVYPCRVILFNSGEAYHNVQPDWSGLANGEVTVHVNLKASIRIY